MSRILYELQGNNGSITPRYLDKTHARITVMGDSLSGKTSFIIRCISDSFTEIERGTYMEDIYHTKINMLNLAQDINIRYETSDNDKEKKNKKKKNIVHPIELQMLDTAEFEIADFSDIRNEQILQSDAFIICFDLTNIESFLNLRTYQRRIERVRGMDDNVPIMIVGTKSDLLMERCVDLNDIIQTLQRFEIDYENNYMEISSQLNINIKSLLFNTLVKVKDYKLEQESRAKLNEKNTKTASSSSSSSSSLSSTSEQNTPSSTGETQNLSPNNSDLEKVNIKQQRVITKTTDLPNTNLTSDSTNNQCCIIC